MAKSVTSVIQQVIQLKNVNVIFPKDPSKVKKHVGV